MEHAQLYSGASLNTAIIAGTKAADPAWPGY
jgi:hypothetical protein